MKVSRTKMVLAFAALLLTLPLVFAGGRAMAQHDQPADVTAMAGQLRMMNDLLTLVDNYHKIASDPSAAGVAAAMGAGDHFQNPKEAIAWYEKVLPNVKDEVIVRAIHLQLADLYKKTGDHEKALAQLEWLMITPRFVKN